MERITKPSPRKFIVSSSPLIFMITMPAKPSTQARIFFRVRFSVLKISAAISTVKNAEQPLAIVPLTPVVFARPT